ncbi:MAG: hypothetical protein Q8T13_02585 [Acidobacteriota bacterium]|nr:hypothetical protein [Acidobacteriota bacterium]
MTRARVFAFILLVAAATTSVSADVRTDQRVKFQLGGAIGKLVNMFGGKGAREGVTSTVAVKGDRKATMSDSTGQIIDLAEEKIYDLDLKKKTYKVTTFAELRQQLEEAKREAEKNAREQANEPEEPTEKDPNAKEYEVDFEIKNTAETRTINGFDTTKSVITVTVREKGKTLDQSGGVVMVTDTWLTPNAPSTKELTDFDMRYAQKLYGPAVAGASAQDMAMAMAMYPQIKPAFDKMQAEGGKLSGTAILTETKVESVPPGTANQAAAAPPPPEEPRKRGLGGMLGGLKKMTQGAEKGSSTPARAVIMTTSVEMLKLTTDVDAASVALPAGFSQSK